MSSHLADHAGIVSAIRHVAARDLRVLHVSAK
jgi:hypothetical protein